MLVTILLIAIKAGFTYFLYRFYKTIKSLQKGDISKLLTLKKFKRIVSITAIVAIALLIGSSFIDLPKFSSKEYTLESEDLENMIVGTWQCLDGNPEMTFLETGEFYFGEIEGFWFFDNDELFINSEEAYVKLPLDHLEPKHIHFNDHFQINGHEYVAPNCRKF